MGLVNSQYLSNIYALDLTIPTRNACVVWLGPMVRMCVQVLARADLRCVNYCPQAGWYNFCTDSEHWACRSGDYICSWVSADWTEMAEEQKCFTLDLPHKMGKSLTTCRRTKSKSPAPHLTPFSPTVHTIHACFIRPGVLYCKYKKIQKF